MEGSSPARAGSSMKPVGFECVHCHHRLSVAAEWAGKAVRCPKCQVVVVAPAGTPGPSTFVPTPTSPPPRAPDLSGLSRAAPETDSIFSDPDDGDGDSLFSGLSEFRKPILPPSADGSQPTLRVPGMPDPPPARATAGARTAIDRPAGMPTVAVAVVVPTEVTNPFRRMVDEVLTEERRQVADEEAEDEADVREADEPTVGSSGWMKWALVGVSVYAALATAAAVWGWTRVPAEPPAVHTPKK